MSMHMAHPALSTTGKRKGKQKWANAEQKQRAQQLDAEWNELMKKWGAEQRERDFRLRRVFQRETEVRADGTAATGDRGRGQPRAEPIHADRRGDGEHGPPRGGGRLPGRGGGEGHLGAARTGRRAGGW